MSHHREDDPLPAAIRMELTPITAQALLRHAFDQTALTGSCAALPVRA